MKAIAKILAFFVLLLVAIAFTGSVANDLYAIVFGLLAVLAFCIFIGLLIAGGLTGIVIIFKVVAAFFNFLFTGEWDIE